MKGHTRRRGRTSKPVRRISLTITPDALRRLDMIAGLHFAANRSLAIDDALRRQVDYYVKSDGRI